MHSRAHLLLKKELATFERLPLPGISAAPVSNDDLYKWYARLEGPEDTEWKGGVFQLNIIFTDEYNAVPPTVNFMTIPFHPNVHPDTGEPVCRLLTDNVWNENHDLRSLLHEVQDLLTNPEDSDPRMIVNHEAAYMYKHRPHIYKQTVMDCVMASLRIEAGISPYDSLSISRSHSDPLVKGSLILLPQIPSSKQSTKRMRQISFDDYHVFWKDLATSVPGSITRRKHQPTAALKLFDPKRRSAKSEQSNRDDIESRMTNHYTLKYGISKELHSTNKQQSKTNDKEYRKKRIAQLMEMYTKDRSTAATEEVCGDDDEADDLVKWTKSLDINDLTSTS